MEILRNPPVDPQLPNPAETLTSHSFWDKYGKVATIISFLVNVAFIILLLHFNLFTLKEPKQLPARITITSTPPIPSITPTSTLDLHEHWQTYTNDDLGIQFQLPETWGVDGPFEHKYRPGIVNDIFISDQKRIRLIPFSPAAQRVVVFGPAAW